MTNLISNQVFDKAFPNERVNCCEPLKAKKFEKDVKRIFVVEKIIDYRCYLSTKALIVYYIAETKEKYIAFKYDIKTRKSEALEENKDE